MSSGINQAKETYSGHTATPTGNADRASECPIYRPRSPIFRHRQYAVVAHGGSVPEALDILSFLTLNGPGFNTSASEIKRLYGKHISGGPRWSAPANLSVRNRTKRPYLSTWRPVYILKSSSPSSYLDGAAKSGA
ncbi:hypothetical protein H104_02924 [Trichophyton rubrum CBS 289.86]|nr:hypothetical protein H104_02924 [Trichophyton rubrum CBS 289.86]EZF86201.1 hypothetical protein H110_02946 [Trichophyton rubrum MR1448]